MYNKNIKSHNKLLHSLQPLTTVDTCYPQAQAAVAGTSPTPGGSSRLHLNCCWMTCVVDVLKKRIITRSGLLMTRHYSLLPGWQTKGMASVQRSVFLMAFVTHLYLHVNK